MACTLITHGRGLDCNRVSGGIRAVYFGVYDTTIVDQTTINSTGEVTIVGMGSTSLYKYSLPRGVASVTDTIVGSTENGTIYYTPSVQVIYNRLTTQDQHQIKLLGQTQLVVFAECNALNANDQNVILCLGSANGMQLNAGTEATGAAWGDRNGYDITFDGMEAVPMAICKDYTSTPFDNLGTSGVLIPIIAA